jgi:hypothetical protein
MPEAIRGPVRRSRTPRAVNRANESIPSPHHPVRTTLRERSIRSPWTWLITSRLHFRPCSACHARLHQGFHHVLSLVAAIQPAYWTLDLVEAPDPARGQDAPNAASGDRDGRSLDVAVPSSSAPRCGGSSRSCPGSGRRASFLLLTDWSGRRVSPLPRPAWSRWARRRPDRSGRHGRRQPQLSGVVSSPGQHKTARSITFHSSRTLPG